VDLSDLINDAVDDDKGPVDTVQAEASTADKWGLGDLLSDSVDGDAPAKEVHPGTTEDKLGLEDLISDVLDGDRPPVKLVWCGCWKDDCEACEAWFQSCLF